VAAGEGQGAEGRGVLEEGEGLRRRQLQRGGGPDHIPESAGAHLRLTVGEGGRCTRNNTPRDVFRIIFGKQPPISEGHFTGFTARAVTKAANPPPIIRIGEIRGKP